MGLNFGYSRPSPTKFAPAADDVRARKRPLLVIVGGGATGVLAAAHLERAGVAKTADLVILEPRADLGRGLAYSTSDPSHLLNVRVANMSAFADDDGHLIRWLRRKAGDEDLAVPSGQAFLARGVYGEYVVDIARGLVERGAVRHIRARCVGLRESPDAVALTLDSGETLVATQALIATGNDAKPALPGIDSSRPWTREALADLPHEAGVMIVGSGLTMVDMALSLRRRGHEGKIHVLSRRGLMPNAHRAVAAHAFAPEQIPVGAPLTALLRWLVGEASKLAREDGDWRSAIDAVRPHTTRLWRAMSLEQRRRFYRHLRPYWDVHRHRMAPEIEQWFDQLIRDGQVERIAGRLVSARSTADGIAVEFRRRGELTVEALEGARLIDCTGLTDDIAESSNPLIRALLETGAARPGPLGLGLDVDEAFALVDARGRSSPRLSVIGPLSRGAHWECIAIPDIRRHCQDFSAAMVNALAAAAVA